MTSPASLATAPTLDYAPLQAADLPEAHALSRAVSWPHRLEDWQLCLQAGQGFAVRRAGELVGTALYWDYTTAATLGLIIVAPHCQGYRIGSTLVARSLEAVSAPVAMLHATVAGAGVYARQGFRVVGSVLQHQGLAQPQPLAPLAPGYALRPASTADLDTLVALDTAASGLHRARLLGLLLGGAQAVVLTHEDTPVGFSMVRTFGRGVVIGPVVAPDLDTAQQLAGHWMAAHAGQFVRLDTESTSGLAPWVQAQGLVCVDEATAMARGDKAPAAPGPRTYALVSQALA